MENYYLYIYKDEKNRIVVNSCDGVFSSIATVENTKDFQDYCDEKAKTWLESKLGNFSGWKEENRRRKSDMWLASKRFPEGKYDFYFNLDDVKDIFCKEVANLAHILRINYKLEIID